MLHRQFFLIAGKVNDYFFKKTFYSLHGGGFNVAFIDGHSETRDPQTLWDTKHFKYRDK